MFRSICAGIFLGFLLLMVGCARIPRPEPIPMSRLASTHTYSAHQQKLVSYALNFSKKKLDYHFGSNDPARGGMDCSGIIQYMLKQVAGLHSPRPAYLIFEWAKKYGHIHYVHAYHFRSPQFRYLKPGDLLFWTGTYHTHRQPPITHIMMYIGKDKQGTPLMFGATEGSRGYRIVRGVGVFDFTLPDRTERARFVAYGCVPFYTCEDVPVSYEK